MRGRKPKPGNLKIIEGNPGKRPLGEEPRPRPLTPTRPEWLLPEAKREWTRIVLELERMGLLTAVDRAALAAYCQAWARAIEAEVAIARLGATYLADSGQWKTRPEAYIAMREWQAVRSFASEFGLTPASRMRMSVAPKDIGIECERCGMALALCGCRTGTDA